jgi:Holliday junction DNA helicase RuvB
VTDDRLVTAARVDEDAQYEAGLRPRLLDEYIGQDRIRENLQVAIAAARQRNEPLDHVLLHGPPGLGKTTLAYVIGNEMGAPVRATSGPAIEKPGDLVGIVTNLKKNEVLFIDEIHRMARSAEEMLYLAMEDFRIDIMVGKGAGATSIPLDLSPFTLVGATTRSGMLPNPLRDRFGFTAHLEFYDTAELEKVLERAAALLELDIDRSALVEIAGRCRGTPRIANRLLRRVRDYALVHGTRAGIDAVHAALELYDVDALGLDRLDRAVMQTVLTRFDGGPVGLNTLAVSVGEEAETIESVVEPFLVRIGLLTRTPRGRVATNSAWRHFGLDRATVSGNLGLFGDDL